MLNFGGGQWAGLVASVAHMPDASACLAPSLQNGREQKESADCIDPPSWAVASDKPQQNRAWMISSCRNTQYGTSRMWHMDGIKTWPPPTKIPNDQILKMQIWFPVPVDAPIRPSHRLFHLCVSPLCLPALSSEFMPTYQQDIMRESYGHYGGCFGLWGSTWLTYAFFRWGCWCCSLYPMQVFFFTLTSAFLAQTGVQRLY